MTQPRTGPEHYTEANSILGKLNQPYAEGGHRNPVAIAQVHAILALAAATALSQREGMLGSEAEAWVAAASEPIERHQTSRRRSI